MQENAAEKIFKDSATCGQDDYTVHARKILAHPLLHTLKDVENLLIHL